MLGFFERQRLVKKGLANAKLRRRRSESELLHTLEYGLIPKSLILSAFLAALSTKVSGKASFKGRLDTYRFCDSVWTFVIRDAVVKLPAGPGGRPPAREELVKKVKVVAVDSRLAGAKT